MPWKTLSMGTGLKIPRPPSRSGKPISTSSRRMPESTALEILSATSAPP